VDGTVAEGHDHRVKNRVTVDHSVPTVSLPGWVEHGSPLVSRPPFTTLIPA
jgi:hypothetical protein